ncbi:MAG: response regulator [Nitrospirae bacterium]|nr:response regulator [Nitrospirota bacterium]
MKSVETGTTVKVLVVDDEENILRAISRLLMDEDLDVMTATSGEEALRILGSNRDVGLIVSDQRMPGLTGVDFLEKAREIAPDTIRIMLTGYADVNAAIDAINRGGAYRYVAKPWKDEELVQIIREAAQRFCLIQENRRLSEMLRQKNEELRNWNAQLEFFVQKQTREIQKNNEELQLLNKRLKQNFQNSIIAFSGLIELRDSAVRNHSRNVAEVSRKAAESLGLPGAEIETITVASLLHDIGKIGIPDVLLRKELGGMSPEELKEYRLHPVRGQAAIDSIEDLREAGILIRHHHESYDGSGFPDRLRGDRIPLGSRIIGMADAVDKAIGSLYGDNAIQVALKSVKDGLGSRFDPALYRHIKASAEETYAEVMIKTDVVELELHPDNLQAGMIISRDVYSGTGLLLLSKGLRLNEKNIQAIRRYYRIDPSRSGVFVMVKR